MKRSKGHKTWKLEMRKWIKEPLLHFLVIGAVIFAGFSILSKEEAAENRNKILIPSTEVERLSNNWSKRMRRPPTEAELQGLIEAAIKEEIYYREALALGLDQNDTILRRRLIQKMEFLSNDIADLNQPNDSELSKYFVDHQSKYKLPARISFKHIFFSIDKRGAKTFEDARKVLQGLSPTAEPEGGDRFMMEYDFVQEHPAEITRLFGSDFAEQLFTLATKTWQGPIQSEYGFHLVSISKKTDSHVPQLESVIGQVRTDWMFEQQQKINKEVYERFKERYEITVEDLPKQSGMAQVGMSGGSS